MPALEPLLAPDINFVCLMASVNGSVRLLTTPAPQSSCCFIRLRRPELPVCLGLTVSAWGGNGVTEGATSVLAALSAVADGQPQATDDRPAVDRRRLAIDQRRSGISRRSLCETGWVALVRARDSRPTSGVQTLVHVKKCLEIWTGVTVSGRGRSGLPLGV